MILFNDCYKNSRVLITGHTGFKGSWLALWLNQLGAEIFGIALNPETQPNHFDLLGLDIHDYRADIRDTDKVLEILKHIQPEIVFHLAAQPLVRPSYTSPLDNWATNVMGTATILDTCRKVEGIKSIVVITTDKVYENKEWPWGYRETDRLGGHDPYSASKAACEILIESYRKSFFSKATTPLLASARAGNVIGGGDWAEDRLVPDLIKSVNSKIPLIIRAPNATRPWQHVLECLSGYLLLGQKLLENNQVFAEAWNFGPGDEDNLPVAEFLELLHIHWPQLQWNKTNESQPHEANLLYLDCSKAKTELKWKPVWNLEKTVKKTADWYREYYSSHVVLSKEQLLDYIKDACISRSSWVQS